MPGKRRIKGGEIPTSSMADIAFLLLIFFLVTEINKVVRRKIKENDKLIISVKAHNKTPYKSYVSVIDQLKMANATRISIADVE